MTDQEICDMATVRLKHLQSGHDLMFGEFDMNFSNHLRAVAVVHDGKIRYIILHDLINNFRKKIKP